MRRTKIDEGRFCAFCERATPIPTPEGGEDAVVCEKYGIVKADHVCRRFRYDMLKREPKGVPPLPNTEVVTLDD